MITRFQNENEFLSNFFIHPVNFEGQMWMTAEHAFQAAKTLDTDERRAIFLAPTPGKAKRLGRSCTLREDWEEVKVAVMKAVVRAKFRDPWLREKLISTGAQILSDGNDWGDTFWGISGHSGRNMLGFILMQIRGEILKDG